MEIQLKSIIRTITDSKKKSLEFNYLLNNLYTFLFQSSVKMLLDKNVLCLVFFVLRVVFVGRSSVLFEEVEKHLSDHVQKQ